MAYRFSAVVDNSSALIRRTRELVPSFLPNDRVTGQVYASAAFHR